MANQSIIEEIMQSIDSINYGSVEVIIQDGQVTQISTRIIKKTNISIKQAKKISGVVLRKGSGSGINLNFKY